MKPSEFYQKYWRFQDKDGNWVEPPKLSHNEKKFMDEFFSQDTSQFIFHRKRKRPLHINANQLRDDYNKLPEQLKKPLQ